MTTSCFLANLLPCEMPKRYTCNGPKSVPNSKRSVPKNVSGRKSFPNLYFWEVATCQEPLILLASSYFPKSSFFLKTNLSIFWGTPHYSPRGTFLYPEAYSSDVRKRPMIWTKKTSLFPVSTSCQNGVHAAKMRRENTSSRRRIRSIYKASRLFRGIIAP